VSLGLEEFQELFADFGGFHGVRLLRNLA
jgi:hypothetical protein